MLLKIIISCCICLLCSCSTSKYIYGVSQLKDYNTGEPKKIAKSDGVYPEIFDKKGTLEDLKKWRKLADLLINHTYGEIEEISVVVECGIMELPHYNPEYVDFPGQKSHYKKDWVYYKEHAFLFYYTFDADEDGGNTFGWVTDEYGNKICWIEDSDLVLER